MSWRLIVEALAVWSGLLGWLFLWRLAGRMSFGYGVWVGAGALAAAHLGVAQAGVAALLGAGVLAGALAAGLSAAVVARLPAMPFAMVTMALGELAHSLAPLLPAWSGGEAGLGFDRTRGLGAASAWAAAWPVALVALAGAVLAALLLQRVAGSAFGSALRAARDDAERAALLGARPALVCAQAMLCAGAAAGLAGAVLALASEQASAESMAPAVSAQWVLFAVLGAKLAEGLARTRHAGVERFDVLGAATAGALAWVLGTVLLPQWTPAWGVHVGLLFLLAVAWPRAAKARGLAVALVLIAALAAEWSVPR